MDLTMSCYENLHRWEDALKDYENRKIKNPQKE